MSDAYDPDNIFARILRGDIPRHEIFEDDVALALMDVMPQSKGHCLVVPKTPSRNLLDADDGTLSLLLPRVARLARAARKAFAADGIVVSQFNEAPAGQTIFHLHFHVIPRYRGIDLVPHSGGMADAGMLAEQAALIRAALD